MAPNVPRNQEMLLNQTVDFEEMAAASGSLDLDENFYGDQDFDMEDFDQEGFDIGGDASTPYEEEKF